VIEVLPEQSTHEQLLNRVRSLARELAEAKAALAAAEGRENDLIENLNQSSKIRFWLNQCAEDLRRNLST
jgi:hypothetical protein